MSDSLNSGNELDNELPTDAQQLQADVQVLDISADMQTIAALESRLDDLTYLAEDIRKSHGMSQSFALEAQRLLPGFNSATPLGFYTKTPTATQLKVSWEEISNGVKALMAALAAAVLALIWKFVAWLGGKKSDGKEGKSSDIRDALEHAKKKTDQYRKAGEAAGELSQAIKDIEHARPEVVDHQGQKRHFADFETLMLAMIRNEKGDEDARLRYIARSTGYADDIIHNGPYTRAISDIQHGLTHYANAISRRMRVITDAIENELNDPFNRDTGVKTSSMLHDIDKDMRLRVGGDMLTIDDAVDRIGQLREQATSGQTNRKVDMSALLDKLHDTLLSAISDQATEGEKALKHLNSLKDAMVSLEKSQPISFEESGRSDSERHREMTLRKLCQGTLLDIQLLIVLHKEGDHYCKIGADTLKYCESMVEIAASKVIASAREHAITMDPATKRLFEMARMVAGRKSEDGSSEIYDRLLGKY